MPAALVFALVPSLCRSSVVVRGDTFVHPHLEAGEVVQPEQDGSRREVTRSAPFFSSGLSVLLSMSNKGFR